MKYNELIVGKKYRCGFAHRQARFVKIQKQVWCGKVSCKAVFRDICDCIIECEIESVEKSVVPYEEYRKNA